MIARENFIDRLKGHAPLPGESPDMARDNFSAMYTGYQEKNLPEPEQVRIRDDLFAYWIRTPASKDRRVMLFFHGGGFSVGSTKDHLGLIAGLAHAADAAVFSIDYRLAPEHRFPAALEDATAAYRFLLEQGYDHRSLVPAGISAGGTLAIGLLLAVRDAGIQLPAAAIAMSPAVDMLFSGDSVERNRNLDWIPPERLHAIREVYLAGSDPRNPLASPVYADLSGLPPLLVQAGTHEVLLDDITRFAEKAQICGVPLTYERYQGMFHCWQVFIRDVAEAGEAIIHAGEFVKKHIP
ncbi:MAG TPA: alpha/beta hydrolase [Methanoregulaceae archaeon]|nr:alpha/beta hydrolase [Methanoregulaceae archaeon]